MILEFPNVGYSNGETSQNEPGYPLETFNILIQREGSPEGRYWIACASTARRLKTAGDIRRYIANLINRTEKGEVDPVLSGKLGYLSSILLKASELSDIEERITEVEKELSKE